MKFGTEVVLGAGRFLVGFWPGNPNPLGMGCLKGVRGASGASAVHSGKNFIKQKLLGIPKLAGTFTFFEPKSGSGRTWAPCPSGAVVTHYEGEFIKSMLHYMSLIAIWSSWTPFTLPPGIRGPKRGARWGSRAAMVQFGGKFIKQKLLGTPT